MTKCIGIISYLPDDSNIRYYRRNKFRKLLLKLKQLFNLPIIVIAQNYAQEDIEYLFNGIPEISVFYYAEALGITEARKSLRQKFLSSQYDWCIMLDDDIEVLGASSAEYLKQIDNNPGTFIEFDTTRLQLFAISRKILLAEDFDDISPEAGDGFEDRIFVNRLRKKYPELRRQFINTGLKEIAIATNDRYSTWYKNQDLISMNKQTIDIIKKL